MEGQLSLCNPVYSPPVVTPCITCNTIRKKRPTLSSAALWSPGMLGGLLSTLGLGPLTGGREEAGRLGSLKRLKEEVFAGEAIVLAAAELWEGAEYTVRRDGGSAAPARWRGVPGAWEVLGVHLTLVERRIWGRRGGLRKRRRRAARESSSSSLSTGLLFEGSLNPRLASCSPY